MRIFINVKNTFEFVKFFYPPIPSADVNSLDWARLRSLIGKYL